MKNSENIYYTFFMSLMCMRKVIEAVNKGDDKAVRFYSQRGMMFSMILMMNAGSFSQKEQK